MMAAVAERTVRALRPSGKPASAATCCALVLCCFLYGCGGSNTRAPVEDRRGGSQSTFQAYYVQRGDTMYSIAFRYGLDYRRLAAANGLSAPYTIYPGQKLYLREATPAKHQTPTRGSVAKSAPAASAPAQPPPAKAASSTAKPVASSGAVNTAVSKPSSTASNNAPSGASGRGEPTWRWPSSGRVTRGYSSSVHKGIDLDGQRGDPVYAVAAGKVVYSGTGIVGFGELLIIKHNEVYLSAYGHNSRLLVAEGDTVRAGEKIAEKGNSGTDTVKLHFEIRKEGKPVDPQKRLPGR